MAITLDGTTGVTAPAFDGAVDAADLTGTIGSGQVAINSDNLTDNVAAARITGALNASGSAPIYACRAWVNFNGTGTVAIRASGNVTSITDNGTGSYTVNFTTAMQDANYAAAVNGGNTGNTISRTPFVANKTTTSCLVTTTTISSGGSVDVDTCDIAIFR